MLRDATSSNRSEVNRLATLSVASSSHFSRTSAATNLFELPLERIDPRLEEAVLQEGALQPSILLLQQLALLQRENEERVTRINSGQVPRRVRLRSAESCLRYPGQKSRRHARIILSARWENSPPLLSGKACSINHIGISSPPSQSLRVINNSGHRYYEYLI